MVHSRLVRLGRLIWIGGLALVLTGLLITSNQAAAQKGPAVQGLWRNSDTTVRITLNKSEIKGVFEQVGQLAQDLGFKAGDVALTGTMFDRFLSGEQTIRYGTKQNCFRERGRKVPLMGYLRADNQVLALHFYNIQVDANCRDTGFYDITETLWEQVSGR